MVCPTSLPCPQADRAPAPVTRRPALAAFVAAALAGVACSWLAARGGPILQVRWRLLLVLGMWALAWVVALVAAFRLPMRVALTAVACAAVAIRLAALGGVPRTSDDLYRYAWDGKVQAQGVDPYAYPPDAPQLAGVRDRWLWPDARGCAALDRPPGCTRINRPDARTIYPPVAEAWFGLVHRVGGDTHRDKTWQLAGMATDLAVLALLVAALHRWRRDVRWVALYALCPAAIFELVQNGHVDGLAIAFVLGAFYVAVPPRDSPVTAARDVAFGLLIGAAALVKIYPAIALVAVPCLPRARPWRSLAIASAAAAVVTVLAYLPHVIAVGTRVIGYLPGYLREEHYSGGGRFLLAGALGLQGQRAAAGAVLTFAATLAWIVLRRPPAPRAVTVALVALFLVTTPVQPWYAVSALAVGALAGWPVPVAVVAAGYPYYFAVILDYRHTVGLGRAAYVVALVAVTAPVLVRRLRRQDAREVHRPAAVEAPVARRPVPGRVDDPALPVIVDERLEAAGRGLPLAARNERP